MKKIFLLLLSLICGFVYAQRKPKIKGNKSVIEISEVLSPYHSIQLNDDLEISLERSADPGYDIVADDNLVKILKFEVKDSTLFISSFYKITGKKQLDIVVRYDELRNITLNDGKLIAGEIISTDEMNLNINGYSQADLRVSAEIAEIMMDGNSKAQLNIESDTLSVFMKDKSQAGIYVVNDSQSIELENDALAEMEGISNTQHLKLSGNSKFKAQSLESEIVNLATTETSLTRLTVNNSLILSSSGSAKIYLYGEPMIEIKEFLDNSELYKRSSSP